MKKFFLYILFAGSILLAASCSKAVSEQSSAAKTTIFGVTLADNDASKTHFISDQGVYKLVWSENDCITVNGVKSNPVDSKFVGGRSATFTVNENLSAPYNLLYGAKDGTDDTVIFPYKQTYTEGTFSAGSAPMWAASQTETFASPAGLFSAIRFTLVSDEADTLQTIALHALGGESISGDFQVGKTSGLLNGTLTPAGGNNSWTALSVSPKLILAEGQSYDFIVTLPAGSYAGGFEAFLTNNKAQVMRLSFLTKSSADLQPNKVYALPSTTFRGGADEYVIATEEDLVTFATLSGTSNAGRKAIVAGDIDMTGVQYKTVSSFYGSIDGGNHKISGLTTSLIGNLYGPVKDLTVEANFEYDGTNGEFNGGTDYGVGILCHYVYATYKVGDETVQSGASLDNITTSGSITLTGPTAKAHAFQIGGVTGSSNGVPLKGCTNKASVTVAKTFSVAAHTEGSTEFTFHAGGIVGTTQTSSSSTLTGCRNEGAVTISGSFGESVAVGGVVGRTYSASAVDGCTNAGSVTVTADANFEKNPDIAGIVGNNYATSSSGYSGMTNCTNEEGGAVTYSGTSKSYVNIGGVCGNSIRETSSNLTNYAPLLVNGTGTYIFTGGIGCQSSGAGFKDSRNYGSITYSGAKHTASTGISVGGVIAKHSCTTGTFSNLENYGTITIEALNSGSTAGRYDVGGVCGYHQLESDTAPANATVTYNKLVNSGKIIIKNAATTNNIRLGGIVGNELHHLKSNTERSNHDINFTECINTGEIDVTVDVAKATQIAGICSDARVSGTVTFTKCSNSGNITLHGYAGSDSSNGGLCIGGILAKGFSNYCSAFNFSECSNSGQLYVAENSTDSFRPAVGGISGLIAATSGKTTDVSFFSCTNSGAILRTRVADYQTLAHSDSKLTTGAGGIAGVLGYYYTGAADYSYVNATLDKCVNTGEVSFSRKKNLGYTSSCEKNTEGTGNYNGGILGLGFSSGEQGVVIRSCVNRGPIKSTAGKDGGIVGFMRKGVHVTGSAQAYTENYGQVHHQGVSVVNEEGGYVATGTPVGYCGGIAGYLFGDPTNTIEYAANYGFLASNYGGGGIVGQFGSSSNPNVGTVRHCKVFFESKASSTAETPLVPGYGGKTALVFGNVFAKDINAFKTVSDIAVGGIVHKYQIAEPKAWQKFEITPDNYCNYVSALTYTPSKSEAVEKNIVFWDGQSKTAWE